jgi:pyruvate,water dikinase
MTTISDPTRGTSEPGRCWTLTNVAEATPEVLSPLCWSVWGDNFERGARQAWYEFGILPRREVRVPDDPNQRIVSCFLGRQALNVDLCREYMGSIPGTSSDDFDRLILGHVQQDSPGIKTSYRRLPLILARAPLVLATQTRLVARTHDEQLGWWRSQVFERSGRATNIERLVEAAGRFGRVFRVHSRSRYLLQGFQSQVERLAHRAEMPELAPRLLSGFGGLEEISIASDVWDVSRQRLSRDMFLARYGFHGPAEGNPISRSWREDPAPVDALIEAIAHRSEDNNPRASEQTAVRARELAERQLLKQLPRLTRRVAQAVMRGAGTQTRNLELCKAAHLMAIDGCRAAARDVGADLVATGVFDDVDDAFYLTIPELTSGPPANAKEIVAFRRARREEYRSLQMPVTFRGMPEPPTSTSYEAAVSGDTIKGAAGASGTVEGPARVVRDLDDAFIEPGEVLVCRFTDPSWAPLFTLADALVVDIGGPASHGAIVARELGVPCVIGTGDGTTRIRTGDWIRVDGDTGVATILKRMPTVSRGDDREAGR